MSDREKNARIERKARDTGFRCAFHPANNSNASAIKRILKMKKEGRMAIPWREGLADVAIQFHQRVARASSLKWDNIADYIRRRRGREGEYFYGTSDLKLTRLRFCAKRQRWRREGKKGGKKREKIVSLYDEEHTILYQIPDLKFDANETLEQSFFKQTVPARFRAFNRRWIRYRGTRIKKPTIAFEYKTRYTRLYFEMQFHFCFFFFSFLSFEPIASKVARVVN